MTKTILIKEHEDFHTMKGKHEHALWQVEQLWGKMPAKNYRIRANLVSAAVDLVAIGQQIDRIGQQKLKVK